MARFLAVLVEALASCRLGLCGDESFSRQESPAFGAEILSVNLLLEGRDGRCQLSSQVRALKVLDGVTSPGSH